MARIINKLKKIGEINSFDDLIHRIKVNFKSYYDLFNTLDKWKYQFQRTTTDYDKRIKYAKRSAKRIGKSKFVGESIIDTSRLTDFLNELNLNGCVSFGKLLSDKKIEEIKKIVEPIKCFDGYNKNAGYFDISNAPKETNVVFYEHDDIIKIPQILDIANDPGILSLVQDYLGATPTISDIGMWWSLKGRDKAKESQLFHRDRLDWKFIKLFVYLTDVGPEDGPHVFVKKSVYSRFLTSSERFNDNEVENLMGKENITTFIAPKGSVFLVDVYGMHKGLLPIKNNRLLFQVLYSLSHTRDRKYKPVDTALSEKYNPYVNRLFFKLK